MNILPHKSWHVRRKDNIARVRKDEAKAAEQEKQDQARIQKAEREARINFLRKQQDSDSKSEPERIIKDATPFDLFKVTDSAPIKSKEFEKEKKIEGEKYEKEIGYLTYLGQYKDEDPHLKRWYEVPKRKLAPSDIKDEEEKDVVKKSRLDPMSKYLNDQKKCERTTKNLKKDKAKESKQLTIEEMRKKRLMREAAEKLRQEKLLNN